MSLDEQIAILKAAKDGEKIQMWDSYECKWSEKFIADENHLFDFINFEYRIAQKNTEVHCVCFIDGVVYYGRKKIKESNLRLTFDDKGDLINAEVLK